MNFFKSTFLFISIFTVYFFCLPTTVQFGDTGELVRSAYTLTVPHPSGYPLFNLTYHAFLGIFQFSTVFWRASFLTALLALGSLYLLWLVGEGKSWTQLLIILTLASTKIFWRYAVLPDVFMLNCFFTAILLYIYLKKDRWQFLMPFIFCIGLCNHITLVFLGPIVLHTFILKYKDKKNWIFSILGGVTFFLIYSSLLLMNPEHFNSWGSLNNFSDLFSHVIRKDYGSFKLISTEDHGGFLKNILYFSTQAAYNFSIVIFIFCILFFKKIRNKEISNKENVLLATISLFIIIFFSLSNMDIIGFKIELFERFLIMPYLMLFFIFLNTSDRLNVMLKNKKIKVALVACFTVQILINLDRGFKINNFSHNSVVNDYAINILSEASVPRDKKPLILINTDTRYNSVKYIQDVLGLYQNVTVTHPRLFFFPWYQKKAKNQGLQANYDQILKTNSMVVEDDFILKNLLQFNIFTNLSLDSSDKYAVTALPIGRMIRSGSGLHLKNEDFLNLKVLKENANNFLSKKSEYDLFREIFSEYSQNYFIMSNFYEIANYKKSAEDTLVKSLDIAPWNYKSFLKICMQKHEPQCEDKTQKIKDETFNYFN